MAKVHFLLLALLFFAAVLGRNKAEAKFVETTHFTWGAHHSSILDTGDDIELVMDKQSGSAFQSENAYLFGSVEMMIKLVPGNSAGTVTAFYLSSLGDRHDEIDFEFLGSVVEKYYIVHTNIFTQGKGDREQEFFLWFDPTADFHNYTIHWNPSKVVWYVDGIPIRVFRNYEKQGIAFPSKQGMRMYGSLWNADWATDAGRIKIDWRFAPFKAWFRNFRARACTWKGPASITQCTLVTPANWYTSPTYSQLSVDEQGQMKQVRDKYMIYDYCKDGPRFNGSIPPECSKPQ